MARKCAVRALYAPPHGEKSTETSSRIDENDRNLPLLVTKAYRHRLFGEFEVRTLNRFVPFIALTYSHELEEWSNPQSPPPKIKWRKRSNCKPKLRKHVYINHRYQKQEIASRSRRVPSHSEKTVACLSGDYARNRNTRSV